MSAPKSEEWFKLIDTAQRYLNTTPNRSTGQTPFQLMFGVHMRLREDTQIREMIESEWVRMFEKKRDDIRQEAKE